MRTGAMVFPAVVVVLALFAPLPATAQTGFCTDTVAAVVSVTLQQWTSLAFEAVPTVTSRTCLVDDAARLAIITGTTSSKVQPTAIELNSVNADTAEAWNVVDFRIDFEDKRSNSTCVPIAGLIQICVAHADDGVCVSGAGASELVKTLIVDELNGPFLPATACTFSAATDTFDCNVLANQTKTELAIRGAFILDGNLEDDVLEVVVKGLSFNGDTTYELSAGQNTSVAFKPKTCPPDTLDANGGSAIAITLIVVLGVLLAGGLTYWNMRRMGNAPRLRSRTRASASTPLAPTAATNGALQFGYHNARQQ